MDCDSVRAELSAELDGESSVPMAGALTEHMTGCVDCQNWRDAAHLLTRRVRLTAARAFPDRTPQILEAVLADQAARRRPGRNRRLLRIGLVAAALAQFVIVVPALVLGQAGIGIPPHASRELGAFNLALAVGFAAAALRPARARGMLPLVGAATAALVVLAFIDAAYGQTTLMAEVPHVIAIFGWLLLHLVARRNRDDPDSTDPTGHRRRRGWWSVLRQPFIGRLWPSTAATIRLPAQARVTTPPAPAPTRPPHEPGQTGIAA